MAEGTEFEFNERKFKDLLLYISKKMSDDPTFGETKLNKVMFFSDFEAYRMLGRPITGAEYQKNLYGTYCSALHRAPRRATPMGALLVERRMVVDHVQDVPKPKDTEPNLAQFADAEVAIIDRNIEELRQYTNAEVSDLSHERQLGWRVLEFGETIPYSSGIINLEPLDDAALGALRERLSA